MCLAQGPQPSDAGEAWTSGPSVSSQALYHWATALPYKMRRYYSNNMKLAFTKIIYHMDYGFFLTTANSDDIAD